MRKNWPSVIITKKNVPFYLKKKSHFYQNQHILREEKRNLKNMNTLIFERFSV